MNLGYKNLPRPAMPGDTFADVEARWRAWLALDLAELARTPPDSWRYQVLQGCIRLDRQMAAWATQHKRKGAAA